MTVRQRGSTWQVDVWLPPHKRVRLSAPDENEALRLEAEIVATIRSGKPWMGRPTDKIGPAGATLKSALELAWNERWKHQPYRSGMGQYRNAETVIALFGANTQVRTISDAHMAEAISILRGNTPDRMGRKHPPRSEVRINRLMQSFSFIFRCARKAGWIDSRPEFDRNQKAEKNRRQWVASPAEEAQLIAYFEALGDTTMADLVAVYLDTGARRNEALGIEGKDYIPGLDGEAGMVRLYVTKGSEPRAVPLLERAEQIIKRRAEQHGDGPLFPGYGPDKVSKRFAEALSTLGIMHPDACVHGLRHTFGTRRAEEGMEPFALQRIMGHANIQTTLGYVKMSPVALREAMKRATRTRLAA